MKRIFIVLFLTLALILPVFSGAVISAHSCSHCGNFLAEGIMGYCNQTDLEEAYGADRIAGWSRLDPAVVDRAIRNASSEIDGFLISGGYTVPLPGAPENLKKYCIDIAAANLVISAGVLDNDPGGKAMLDEARNARHFLEKVAEGKYKIPGYTNADEEVSSPPGGVVVSAGERMDLRGY